jgi:hypothetical protein
MKDKRLVFGLLDASADIGDARAAQRLRDFTISWARYGYHGDMVEGREINRILDDAVRAGYRHCLVLEYGLVIVERWTPAHWDARDFHGALAEFIAANDFFIAGAVNASSAQTFELTSRCLLVNLAWYERLGRPRFSRAGSGLVRVELAAEGRRPRISALPASILDRTLDLFPRNEAGRQAMLHYLREGLAGYQPGAANGPLTAGQKDFLRTAAVQTASVRRGVFVWNVEPYTDVEEPPPDFKAPVTTLYSVAAGFKSNRILQTHGFDPQTRVVFFDYSQQGLTFKKLLRDEWDGANYPAFLRYVLRKLPPPETYYPMWMDLKPEQIDWTDMEKTWQAELARWGGAQAFQEHWRSYRQLAHEYVHCDLLDRRGPLLECMRREPNAAIWWSNAFFTVLSNWQHTLPERKAIYDGWVEQLAGRNPDLWLYGFDYNNTAVNHLRAGPYLAAYFREGGDYLKPAPLHRLQIRC